MVTIDVLEIVIAIAVCVPSGIVAFCFWLLERRLDRRQKDTDAKQEARRKEIDTREKKRQENEVLTTRCLMASLELGEATARAVERIPDCNCNGDMHTALDYAAQVKKEQKEFLEREGIEAIYKAQKDK